MKHTGIWLDKEKALIVTLDQENETFTTIKSQIEDFRAVGGSGTKFKGGPQDVVQDSKFLEREKHQMKTYFKNIVAEIKNNDAIVIFGPAEAGEKFNKEIQENYSQLNSKVKGVKKADSMTDNQVKAWVKDFFKSV
jgi:stalled ribosome rescue protein Dom34